MAPTVSPIVQVGSGRTNKPELAKLASRLVENARAQQRSAPAAQWASSYQEPRVTTVLLKTATTVPTLTSVMPMAVLNDISGLMRTSAKHVAHSAGPALLRINVRNVITITS